MTSSPPPRQPDGGTARYIFVNRFCHPDISATSQILSDLVFYLAEQGHDVHVVCSRQLYQDPKAKLPKTEVVRGVTVHRVWSTRFGRYNILGRIFDSLTFLLAVIVRLIAMTSKRDVVIAKTDPPMLGFCVYLAAVLRRFQLVHWLQDLFPEIAEVSVERRSLRIVLAPVWWVLRGLRNLSLRRARLNVVIGESMGARLRANGVPADKITVLTNWSPGDQVVPVPKEGNPLIAEWGLEGKFLVVYSGNMGRVHEFDTLLGAAELLRDEEQIRFLFIGGGPAKQRVVDEVARRGLQNARFLPYQPAERLAYSLGAADVHVVTLQPRMEGLVVPSKFYGILAAARPVLYVGASSGEVSRAITAHQIGMGFTPDAGHALATAILGLCSAPERAQKAGRSARALFEHSHSRGGALSSWTNLAKSLSKQMAPHTR